MGDMSQSSSRVKLNRVALKDVVGVKVAPRRRKVPNSRTDTPKEEDSSMLEDSGWNKPPRGVLSHRKTAENGRATSTRQEKRVGMHVEAVQPHPKERRLQTGPKTTNMPRKTKVIVAAPLASRKSSKRRDLSNGRSVSGARGREEPRARKAKSARRLLPPASAAPRPPPSSKVHRGANVGSCRASVVVNCNIYSHLTKNVSVTLITLMAVHLCGTCRMPS